MLDRACIRGLYADIHIYSFIYSRRSGVDRCDFWLIIGADSGKNTERTKTSVAKIIVCNQFISIVEELCS